MDAPVPSHPPSPGGAGVRGSPGVQEQGQPQAVELVGDLWVEEGQEAAHLVQAVHLQRQAALGGRRGPGPHPRATGSKGWVTGNA